MKSVMVIIDGLGDEPIQELDNQTPLEAAFIPHIQYIADKGRVGRINTTFEGFPIESMVCIMGLIGYEPDKFYPSGRASFEATAQGILLNEGDLILRCNLVSADLDKQILTDFTAGQISDSNAKKIISKIKLPYDNWELYPAQSYRNILVIRGANVDVRKIKCFEPHMHIGEKINSMMPTSNDKKAVTLIQQINKFLLDTQKQITQMNIHDNKASMLWVWSPSTKAVWPTFKDRTGLNAAFVGGLDFLHGIAMAADIDFEKIPGATGYIDTNYSAKAEYAMRYIDEYDFVLVHINAADEEAHLHNYKGKIKAIEKVDKYVVAPILDKLSKEYTDSYKIIVLGDHMTRCVDGRHTDQPVPYALCGVGIRSEQHQQFSEKNCLLYVPSSSLKILNEITK